MTEHRDSAESAEPRCWRSECRTGCYYPGVCSERQAEFDHTLTDAEKRLRDWLMQHPEGGEMWCIVKGGFRRSYRLGQVIALNEAEREASRHANQRSTLAGPPVKVGRRRRTMEQPLGRDAATYLIDEVVIPTLTQTT